MSEDISTETRFQHKLKHIIALNVNDDEPAVFNLSGSKTAQSYANVDILWTNPKAPLTLVIETSYTDANASFRLVSTHPEIDHISQIYQIIRGEEVNKSTGDVTVNFDSDWNCQVVLKLIPGRNAPETVRFSYAVEKL